MPASKSSIDEKGLPYRNGFRRQIALAGLAFLTRGPVWAAVEVELTDQEDQFLELAILPGPIGSSRPAVMVFNPFRCRGVLASLRRSFRENG